jgi:HEAT repeat protein
LLALLTHEAVEIRQKAARALARIADPAALDGLLAALGDPNPVVRGNIVRALGRIGDPRALPALNAALDDTAVTVFSLERGELRVSDLARTALAELHTS